MVMNFLTNFGFILMNSETCSITKDYNESIYSEDF